MVPNYLILKLFANLFNKLLKKYLPWSVSTPFGNPNMQIPVLHWFPRKNYGYGIIFQGFSIDVDPWNDEYTLSLSCRTVRRGFFKSTSLVDPHFMCYRISSKVVD